MRCLLVPQRRGPGLIPISIAPITIVPEPGEGIRTLAVQTRTGDRRRREMPSRLDATSGALAKPGLGGGNALGMVATKDMNNLACWPVTCFPSTSVVVCSSRNRLSPRKQWPRFRGLVESPRLQPSNHRSQRHSPRDRRIKGLRPGVVLPAGHNPI